jgi:phosphonate transport system substrate-binding protein
LVETKKIDPTKIRQLALSDPIPNYPLTMQGYLQPELKDAIRRAFLNLKDPVILKLFRVEAIAAATDKDYDVLRDMAKVLQLDIAKL